MTPDTAHRRSGTAPLSRLVKADRPERYFVGGRIRALRTEQRVTQAAFANTLGISASYLNQLEHNSRPLTNTVLAKISDNYGVDSAFFASGDDNRLVAEIADILTDPELGADVETADVADLVRTHPSLASAFTAVHRRLRNAEDLLAAATESRNAVASSSGSAVISMPHEEVRDYFYQRQNYVHELDLAAEHLANEVRRHRGEPAEVLAARLRSLHSVRIRRRVDLPETVWHQFDQSERRLDLSAHLTRGQQTFRMAAEIAHLEHGELLRSLSTDRGLTSAESRALCLIGLANYFAAAVILPYNNFLDTAAEFRYDIERLCTFYNTSYETICHRLSTLQRPSRRGIPFSFVRVDRAGNMSKRQSATGFHFTSSGGTCPLWNVYDTFSAPGKVMRQVAEMPDGRLYLWVARTVTTRPARFSEPRKTFAIGLGCEVRHAHQLVYADGLDLRSREAATKIGSGCRVCQRKNCSQRAFPPVNRPLNIDIHRSSLAPYLTADEPLP